MLRYLTVGNFICCDTSL